MKIYIISKKQAKAYGPFDHPHTAEDWASSQEQFLSRDWEMWSFYPAPEPATKDKAHEVGHRLCLGE